MVWSEKQTTVVLNKDFDYFCNRGVFWNQKKWLFHVREMQVFR